MSRSRHIWSCRFPSAETKPFREEEDENYHTRVSARFIDAIKVKDTDSLIEDALRLPNPFEIVI